MTNLLIKVRDILGDNYQTITETQDYISSMIFSLQYANGVASLKIYKNGVLWSLTPVAGTGVEWARTLTAVTIKNPAHGLITGDSVTISVTSDAAALPLGTYVVTKLTANTFTIAGLNAGASSGTCTYTITANYSYSAGIVTESLVIRPCADFVMVTTVRVLAHATPAPATGVKDQSTPFL